MSNRFSWRRNLLCLVVAALALPLVPAVSRAESKSKDAAEPAEAIDLFEAVKQGKVETKFVAQNANRGNLLVKNLTKQPLDVRVPDAFGAVHVLGQFGGGGMGGGMGGMGGGMGGMGGGMGGMGGGGGQTMGGGGGMGGMGGGGMGMGGMGGGMFRVAPEKTHKIVSNTVCLEFGKPDPNSIMTYNIVPIESVAKDARVVELCRMLSRGEIPTNVAQAAAWHLTDGLTWEKLASLDRVRSRYSGTIKFFNSQELQYASTVLAQIEKKVGSSGSSRDRYNKPYESDNVSYSAAGASVQVSGGGFAAGSAGAVVVGNVK